MRSLAESLFWEVFYRREALRSQLASALHVSAATISRAVGTLVSKGLVIETGAPSGSRGRRPTLLKINPCLAYVGGIEMDRDRTTAVVTDLEGNLLGRGALDGGPGKQVDDTLRDAACALDIAMKDAGLGGAQLARIGVGHTGMLDVNQSLCLDWDGAPHWRGVPLAEKLREVLGAEITLDDRARAVALALHLTWPEARRHAVAIYVQIGTGIGSGIFVNGRMLRGATQSGGELGHMTIDRNGPMCACGRRGCVEAFASVGATLARVRDAIERGERTVLGTSDGALSDMTAEDVVAAARQGDSVARATLEQTGEALGVGIANAVQLLNPSLVALAGKFSNTARDFLPDVVTRTIATQCFRNIARGMEIRVAPFRKDAGPVGCALLATVDVASGLVDQALFAPMSHAKSGAIA